VPTDAVLSAGQEHPAGGWHLVPEPIDGGASQSAAADASAHIAKCRVRSEQGHQDRATTGKWSTTLRANSRGSIRNPIATKKMGMKNDFAMNALLLARTAMQG
jgi:hypothetical protein